MRDRGEPTLVFHERGGTPEEIAKSRERLRSVCEEIVSRMCGRPMRVELKWPSKELWMKNDL